MCNYKCVFKWAVYYTYIIDIDVDVDVDVDMNMYV